MKFAVISDIHGNLLALQAVLADIRRQGVDQIINLGDILSGPLQPAETADLLMENSFVTIRGNHERQVLELIDGPAGTIDPASTDGYTATRLKPAHIAWIRSLPERLELEGGEVLLCHGTPASDLVYWLETVVPGYTRSGGEVIAHPGVRAATPGEVAARLGHVTAPLVLCGHTHVPRTVRSAGTLIVNPGSVGLQAYDDAHPLPHVIETGSPLARYAIVERSAGAWQAWLLQVAYEHRVQARLACQRGRRDWARGLGIGRALWPAAA